MHTHARSDGSHKSTNKLSGCILILWFDFICFQLLGLCLWRETNIHLNEIFKVCDLKRIESNFLRRSFCSFLHFQFVFIPFSSWKWTYGWAKKQANHSQQLFAVDFVFFGTAHPTKFQKMFIWIVCTQIKQMFYKLCLWSFFGLLFLDSNKFQIVWQSKTMFLPLCSLHNSQKTTFQHNEMDNTHTHTLTPFELLVCKYIFVDCSWKRSTYVMISYSNRDSNDDDNDS